MQFKVHDFPEVGVLNYLLECGIAPDHSAVIAAAEIITIRVVWEICYYHHVRRI